MKQVEVNFWLSGLMLVIIILFTIDLIHANPPIAALLIAATIFIIEFVQLFRRKLLGINFGKVSRNTFMFLVFLFTGLQIASYFGKEIILTRIIPMWCLIILFGTTGFTLFQYYKVKTIKLGLIFSLLGVISNIIVQFPFEIMGIWGWIILSMFGLLLLAVLHSIYKDSKRQKLTQWKTVNESKD